LILLVLLAAGHPASARENIAFYPLLPVDSDASQEAAKYLQQAIGGHYGIIPPEIFQPLLEKEQTNRPDYPVSSLYPVLAEKLQVGYVITGTTEKSGPDSISYEISVLDLVTYRSRIFNWTSPEKKNRVDLLRRMGREILTHLNRRDNLKLPSNRDSDLVKTLVSRLPKGPRPPVAIAINEQINGKRSERLFAEQTLDYYLKNAGFPVKYGESLLLREYSRFFFAEKQWAFPRTLTSEFYVIGEASAEQTEKDEIGLDWARTEVKARLLDKHGTVILTRNFEVRSSGLSPEAAAAKALQTTASEIAFEIFPLLRY